MLLARTINERINQLSRWSTSSITTFEHVPQVIQLDGIWGHHHHRRRMMLQDRRNRGRHQRQGQKDGDLSGIGVWTENGQEKREIVDWQIAQSEKHEEWEVLLRRLVVRGPRPFSAFKPSFVTDVEVWAEQWKELRTECD